MPVALATGFLGESLQARRAAHERAENVSPAGLEDAASHGPEVDTSGIDLPPSGLNRVVSKSALYAVSWTTLENWSEYFLKNLRTKKLQEGIFQVWFAFDRKVPIEVVYQLSDSVTQITICPEYPAILRHQLPVPDW